MNDEWETPPDLFNRLDDEFKFGTDAACTKENSKLKKYGLGIYKEDYNSLEEEWVAHLDGACNAIWLNPPYSRGNIDKFMEKAYKESLKGATIVCLVRFDPSAKWFQNWVHDKAEQVRMLARRVKFVGAPSAYNFPTCIVVYDPEFNPEIEYTIYSIWDWK